MTFMVTFPLTHHAYKERVKRFLESGAPPPEGVNVRGRWFIANHSKGSMHAETDDATALCRWVSHWADVIDFQIVPVIGDEGAASILRALL